MPIISNCRQYGEPPYRTAVVHGGPGAPGSAAPLARELARDRGVLEPLQTATTLDEQVAELADTLARFGSPPIALVGHSWGAWLALIVAALHPDLVDRLILVASGAFEERYTKDLLAARLARLDEFERDEARVLLALPGGPTGSDFGRFGALMGKADAYDPLPHEPNDLPPQPAAYAGVWPAAAALRRSGELLRLAGTLSCPVTAIHGADDPSPAAGVREPLAAVVRNFHFVLLAC